LKIPLIDWKNKRLRRADVAVVLFVLLLGIAAYCVLLVRQRGQALDDLIAGKQAEMARYEALLASRSQLAGINASLKRALANGESRVLLKGDDAGRASARLQSYLTKSAQELGIRVEGLRPLPSGRRQGYEVLSLEISMTSGLEELLKMFAAIAGYDERVAVSSVRMDSSNKGEQQTLRTKLVVSGLLGPYDPQKKPSKSKGGPS
jgi:hypothetical protein